MRNLITYLEFLDGVQMCFPSQLLNYSPITEVPKPVEKDIK